MHENPADHTSRPQTAEDIMKLDLWWRGPSWIQSAEVELPTQPVTLQQTIELKSPFSLQNRDIMMVSGKIEKNLKPVGSVPTNR